MERQRTEVGWLELITFGVGGIDEGVVALLPIDYRLLSVSPTANADGWNALPLIGFVREYFFNLTGQLLVAERGPKKK